MKSFSVFFLILSISLGSLIIPDSFAQSAMAPAQFNELTWVSESAFITDGYQGDVLDPDNLEYLQQVFFGGEYTNTGNNYIENFCFAVILKDLTTGAIIPESSGINNCENDIFPNETKILGYNSGHLPVGHYMVSLILDSDNKFKEFNELDNIISVEYVVSSKTSDPVPAPDTSDSSSDFSLIIVDNPYPYNLHVDAGETFIVPLLYENLGPDMAQSYRLTAEISHGLSFDTDYFASHRDYQGNIAIDHWDNMVPGVESTPSYKIYANNDGGGIQYIKFKIDNIIPTDPKLENNVAELRLEVFRTQFEPTNDSIDLSINDAYIVGSDTITPGDLVKFRFEYENSGPSISKDTILEVHPSNGFQIENIPADCIIPWESKPRCHLGDVPPGKYFSPYFEYRFTDEYTPNTLPQFILDIKNQAIPFDQSYDNNRFHLKYHILPHDPIPIRIPSAMPTTDLSLSASLIPHYLTSINLGDLFTYQFIVTNNGPSPAQNVIIVVPESDDYSLMSSTVCTIEKQSSGTTHCILNDLQVGGSNSVEITFKANSATNGKITVHANTISSTEEINFSNNAVIDSVDIFQSPANTSGYDLEVSLYEKVDSKLIDISEGYPGDVLSFQATLTNLGNEKAKNLGFGIDPNDGVEILNFSPTPGCTIYNNGFIECLYSTLNPFEGHNVFFDGKISEDVTTASIVVNAKAEGYYEGDDLNLSNNEIIRNIEVLPSVSSLPVDDIPDWVKNVAGFWCDDKVLRSEFIDSIKYLIDEEIIDVTANEFQNQKNSKSIPLWIKQNACWWSENKITDDEFAKAIKYLIETGLINTSNDNSEISISTDRQSYDYTHNSIFISGNVLDCTKNNCSLALDVTNSQGESVINEIDKINGFHLNGKGNFEYDLQIKSKWLPGEYVVDAIVEKSAQYQSSTILGQTSFLFIVLDSDNDGISDQFDNCPKIENPNQENNDVDSMGDVCDTDDDNDGANDIVESNHGTDPLNWDTDGDTISDFYDQCNDEQETLNGYMDDDGCEDIPSYNKIPFDQDEFQILDVPNLSDIDDDKILDVADNCIGISNLNQMDENNNGIGDECEPILVSDVVTAIRYVGLGGTLEDVHLCPGCVDRSYPYSVSDFVLDRSLGDDATFSLDYPISFNIRDDGLDPAKTDGDGYVRYYLFQMLIDDPNRTLILDSNSDIRSPISFIEIIPEINEQTYVWNPSSNIFNHKFEFECSGGLFGSGTTTGHYADVEKDRMNKGIDDIDVGYGGPTMTSTMNMWGDGTDEINVMKSRQICNNMVPNITDAQNYGYDYFDYDQFSLKSDVYKSEKIILNDESKTLTLSCPTGYVVSGFDYTVHPEDNYEKGLYDTQLKNLTILENGKQLDAEFINLGDDEPSIDSWFFCTGLTSNNILIK